MQPVMAKAVNKKVNVINLRSSKVKVFKALLHKTLKMLINFNRVKTQNVRSKCGDNLSIFGLSCTTERKKPLHSFIFELISFSDLFSAFENKICRLLLSGRIHLSSKLAL